MSAKLMPDGLGGQGLSVRAFALQSGLSYNFVKKLCENGKIQGAHKHRLTHKWWIYPPAKLLCATPRDRHGRATLSNSGLRECGQG